ncbi:ImmA/IrrE family metallo-endopeptidase [uncultured Jatrophihabitans sp.]|uniref:ImmA/IrrE family metallo-endopeptidase n=1 Tax=uncultured Jatrophihabitans sp. TaxID=1610747 RepID=UPI0035CC5986
MIAAGRCHDDVGFTDRPPAGTNPWSWWRDTFASSVVLDETVNLGRTWGLTLWTAGQRRVFLHPHLTAAQRRLTIAHEMHHLAIGGVCRARCPEQERHVNAETVRWLLPDVDELQDQPVADLAARYKLPEFAVEQRLLELPGGATYVDPVAVERDAAGKRLHVRPIERRAAAQILSARGLRARQASERLGCSARTVVRCRAASLVAVSGFGE